MNIILLSASAGITGFESPSTDYHQLPLSLDELLIEHPSSTYIGKAQGRSMEGVGIYDGDILIIDRYVKVQNQDVIVANYNGEFVCKIIDLQQRQLVSASLEHSPVFIPPDSAFTIEGVVVRSIRCHRPSRLLTPL